MKRLDPRPRTYRPMLALAFIAVLLQCACYNSPPDKLAVWSEFLAPDAVRPELGTLADHQCELYLAINPNSLNDAMATFLKDANDAGVPVRLWLQLPDDGVWLNDMNATAFADFTNKVLDWIEANDVPVSWLIFDIEPSYAYSQALNDRRAMDGIFGVLDLLQMHRDLAAFTVARSTIQQTVDTIHARGLQVMAVSLPWVVDDLNDGDDDLQDMFDTPVTGIDWDAVSFTLYRSTLSVLVGVPLSPAFVADYSQRIRAHFGDDAEIALGTISTPGLIISSGYTDPVDVWLDVMAVRASGLHNVSLYSLDGMLVAGGTEPWIGAADTPTITLPVVDPFAGVVPLLFNGLDALANK